MRITIISITLFLIMTKLLVGAESISRADFPEGFVFGTASSAHQFEGATDEGNKGDSIWDTFSRIPGRIVDFSNADKAVDQYHRFQVNYRKTHLLTSILLYPYYLLQFSFSASIFGACGHYPF